MFGGALIIEAPEGLGTRPQDKYFQTITATCANPQCVKDCLDMYLSDQDCLNLSPIEVRGMFLVCLAVVQYGVLKKLTATSE